MDTSTTVMLIAALVTLVALYWKSPAAASDGLNATRALILEIIPRILAAFTLAGLIQAVVPQELIVKRMGHGTGVRRILIGMTLGSVTPGGLMTHFPIIASVFQGRGWSRSFGRLSDRLVSFRTAVHHHVGDSISRAKVVALRVAVSFFFPFLAGWLCETLWGKLRL